MLQARPHARHPLALVRPAADDDATGFTLGTSRVTPHAADAAAEAAIRDRLAVLAAAVDLREPFERIRAAIEEAQRH
jgi:hypothetical protein